MSWEYETTTFGSVENSSAASVDDIRTIGTASFGPFRLNAAKRLLERNNEPVVIGSRSLDILIALVERAGEVSDLRLFQRHA